MTEGSGRVERKPDLTVGVTLVSPFLLGQPEL